MSDVLNKEDAAVEAAAVAARKSADDARNLEATAARVKAEQAQALKDRADKIEAAIPRWEVIHRIGSDVTERLVIPGGYLVRSAWRHGVDLGVDPLMGSAVAFVAGTAPDLYKKGEPVVIGFAELPRGVNPDTATVGDLVMTPRLDAASEILLRMPDSSVRVLRAAPVVVPSVPSTASREKIEPVAVPQLPAVPSGLGSPDVTVAGRQNTGTGYNLPPRQQGENVLPNQQGQTAQQVSDEMAKRQRALPNQTPKSDAAQRDEAARREAARNAEQPVRKDNPNAAP